MSEDTHASDESDETRVDGGTDGAEAEPLEPQPIEPAAPEEFGLVQAWWGDGKGKTTAALGMGFRAAGHGYRVHMLQFLKGGTASVEDVRGEYNAVAQFPGFSYENSGHYGWHRLPDGSDDERHEANARAGFERAEKLVDAADEADLSSPLALDGPPEDGCHMLILDEILYALGRGLVSAGELIELIEAKPEDLELVLTGGHDEPAAIVEHADLVTEVSKGKHPIDAGQPARKGTEF
ncbi:cobalamin adenosyltransferase [Halobacteriales archaeon QH_6_66_25]|nr:MAG: cobalamin adenosyltransferase [Halobacteriales archaeon QH_6_66_25]